MVRYITLGLIMGLVGTARAECGLDRDHTTGIELADRAPTDYELAFELAEIRCDAWAQGQAEDHLLPAGEGGLLSADEYDRQLGSMYEACMRLSVPPMVLTPTQHYDTSDGAFWRTVQL